MIHVEHNLLLHFLFSLLALDHTFVKLNVKLFLILHKLINLPQHDILGQTYLLASLIGWDGRFVQLELEAGVLPRDLIKFCYVLCFGSTHIVCEFGHIDYDGVT